MTQLGYPIWGGLSLTWDISLFVSSLKIPNWMMNLFGG